ncbi:MAG: TetR/AcrR family transcriptional regulator [Pseudomonadales bacterium]|nr:TetR/AcrR family transcriptional regulator [Pseudomonadales bacterium]
MVAKETKFQTKSGHIGACGNRREQAREARRLDILDAGFAEFTREGFTATRLEDVAARAGIGKGTIYLYFDSKESLFEEVVRMNLLPPVDAILDMISKFEGSTSELLTLHLHHSYAILRNEKIPALIAMVIGEGNRFPKLTDFFFREMVSANQTIIRDIIARGVRRGEFRETELSAYTQIVIAPVLISAIWKLQFESLAPIDLDAFAATHIDLILNGLRKNPDT